MKKKFKEDDIYRAIREDDETILMLHEAKEWIGDDESRQVQMVILEDTSNGKFYRTWHDRQGNGEYYSYEDLENSDRLEELQEVYLKEIKVMEWTKVEDE